MNRCTRCSGFLFADEDGVQCLLCGRPVGRPEPLPYVNRNEGKRYAKPKGIKETDGVKPVPVHLPSVVTMRDRKRGKQNLL